MQFEEICAVFYEAVYKFICRDRYLLLQNINERAISHRLALYLENRFDGYDVDCEYDGYAMTDGIKKHLIIERKKLENLGHIRDSDPYIDNLERSVYPDIIIHKRGDVKNLLIIEVKKDKNKNKEFDREKLKLYTSNDEFNKLSYEWGAFVVFSTGEKALWETEWYKGGKLCSKFKFVPHISPILP